MNLVFEIGRWECERARVRISSANRFISLSHPRESLSTYGSSSYSQPNSAACKHHFLVARGVIQINHHTKNLFIAFTKCDAILKPACIEIFLGRVWRVYYFAAGGKLRSKCMYVVTYEDSLEE